MQIGSNYCLIKSLPFIIHFFFFLIDKLFWLFNNFLISHAMKILSYAVSCLDAWTDLYANSEVCKKVESFLLVKLNDTFNKNKKLLRYLAIK